MLAEQSPLCPEHGDVDAILQSGEYTDWRGREWFLGPLSDVWLNHAVTLREAGGRRWRTPDEMRLLIERETHRAGCPGLHKCNDHPVPRVWIAPARFKRRFRAEKRGITSRDWAFAKCATLAEALTAARSMAGGGA